MHTHTVTSERVAGVAEFVRVSYIVSDNNLFAHADWQLGHVQVLFTCCSFTLARMTFACCHLVCALTRWQTEATLSLSRSSQGERAHINRLAIILAILICNANSWGGRLLTASQEAREN